MSPLTTIFGGALIGTSFTTPREVQELLDQLKTLQIKHIDTAARYAPTNPGSSERLLGEVRAAEQGFTIDTKVSPGISPIGDTSGTLTSSAIAHSVSNSFHRLKTSKVNVLYFHWPDPQTPVAEQAGEINRQYKEGHFEKFGLSNFSPESVAEFLAVCEEKGYCKPSVFQGRYNLLVRESEETLFPLLRKHGIVFNAYSPLAGGFLTGLSTRGEAQGTRFDPQNNTFKRNNAMYDKAEMHAAVSDLLNTIEPLQITAHEACLRWIYYHSALREGDGVILGASKISQIVQNVSDIAKGSLPEVVVEKVEELWEVLRG